MNFQEKGAWASLLTIVLVHIPYFAVVFRWPESGIGLLIVASIGHVVLLTGFHIVNAIMTKSIRQSAHAPAPDELDRMIESRAAKIAAFVLAFAVMSWVLVAVFGLPGLANAEAKVDLRPMLLAVQALYAGFVLANVVYFGLIVSGYRRIVHA